MLLTLISSLYYILAFVSFCLVFAVIFKMPIGTRWLRLLTVIGVGVFIARVVAWSASAEAGFDFAIFHRVGTLMLAGIDPYNDREFSKHPFLNPPTALPLFAVFALVPERLGRVIWMALNTILCISLVPLSRQVLRSLNPSREWTFPPGSIGALSLAVIYSNATKAALFGGQLSIITAFSIIVGLIILNKSSRYLTGIALAVATIKVGTMLPFLLILLRKRYVSVLAVTFSAIFVLCLSQPNPLSLPEQLSALVKHIAELSREGKINDYSTKNTNNFGILGFDSVVYWFGLNDRSEIRLVEWIGVFSLGFWVARRVLPAERLPQDAASCLVALYSVLFLYHRNYDTVIFALPLTYAGGRAMNSLGRERVWFVAAFASALLAMYQYDHLSNSVVDIFKEWGFAGRMIRDLAMSAPTWLVIVAIFCFDRGVNFGLVAPSYFTRPVRSG